MAYLFLQNRHDVFERSLLDWLYRVVATLIVRKANFYANKFQFFLKVKKTKFAIYAKNAKSAKNTKIAMIDEIAKITETAEKKKHV